MGNSGLGIAPSQCHITSWMSIHFLVQVLWVGASRAGGAAGMEAEVRGVSD